MIMMHPPHPLIYKDDKKEDRTCLCSCMFVRGGLSVHSALAMGPTICIVLLSSGNAVDSYPGGARFKSRARYLLS
jgi:hypothetical protein